MPLRKIKEIDRGGFGIVDLVEDESGRRFARKTFEPKDYYDPEKRAVLRRRFEREVRTQAAIKHPNVMPIKAFDLEVDPPWFTMPLAAQTYEAKYRADLERNDFDREPWHDILDGVEEIHRLGFVHRDLKPANILEVDGRWVVSDFGLVLPSKSDTGVLTGSTGQGTQAYAAPEQIDDFHGAGSAADVFALACILHDATDRNARRIPFSRIDTNGPLAVLLERATEVDHRRRLPSVAEFRAALFGVWTASHEIVEPPESSALVAAVRKTPNDTLAWRRLIHDLEQAGATARDAELRAIDAALVTELRDLDESLFERLVSVMCQWAAENAFEWQYCDVIGDRLYAAYQTASVRTQILVVLALIELGCSHRRWRVMRQVVRMLGPAAQRGLVDRLLIEMQIDPDLDGSLRVIESQISMERSAWHPDIGARLNQRRSGEGRP